jgi:hypothetical protein
VSGAPPPGEGLSFAEANRLALLAIPACLLPVAAHALAWGPASLLDGGRRLLGMGLVLPFVIVAAIAVHEALHAAGFLLVGRVPRDSVRFGVHARTLTPFAGCAAPMAARAYRIAALLPAAVLGVVPAAWGLAAGDAAATLWGAFMLASAGGDFAVIRAMRGIPARARVLDLEGRVGCQVVG